MKSHLVNLGHRYISISRTFYVAFLFNYSFLVMCNNIGECNHTFDTFINENTN